MKRKKLTAQAFAKTVKRMNLSEKTKEIARRILVDGHKQSDVAEENGLTPQTVNGHAQRVWLQYTKDAELPPGTKRITVLLSDEKAALVLEWEREERISRLTLD